MSGITGMPNLKTLLPMLPLDLETALNAWIRTIEAEHERLRAALEEIADGVGCDSHYGPGCDTHCKTIARRALAPSEGDGGPK